MATAEIHEETKIGKSSETSVENESEGRSEKYSSIQDDRTRETNIPISKEFDLTDPEQLLKMLETVELSEEDTDVLLQEAYKVNKKLKECLRRQEMDEHVHDHHHPPRKPSGKSFFTASSSASSAKSKSPFSRASVLPPISVARQQVINDLYTEKLGRSQSVITSDTYEKIKPARRAKTRPPEEKEINTAKPPRTKTADFRPDWNNRFSYE
ncbi:hypothetical protein CHS0354_010494 [Potamilus streckersoni]|uniref:Uncharacterized protein n=1 Tax=Potamilus streckersoni TaxID=2493646 RepID=A0AAE0RS18_9BIVA|nr:hypothetical protein CHS0354_010494 [Potamilus streckersoni]